MKNNPFVSVIMPVYNDEKFLEESLGSVLAQTMTNLEIICVNDGSTDDSANILESFARKDPRIHIITKEANSGTLMARKAGVDAASGEYATFLDADDCLDSTACERAYRLAKEDNTDIVWFTAEQLNHDETGKLINKINCPPSFKGLLRNKEQILSHCFLRKDRKMTCLWGKLYRTSILKQAHKNMDDLYCVYGEDLYESFHIFQLTESFKAMTTEPLYIYHMGRGVCGLGLVSMDRYEEACKMSLLYGRAREFLLREGTLEENSSYLDAWKHRMMEDCIYFAMQRVDEKDYDKASRLLTSYWGNNDESSLDLCSTFLRLVHESKVHIDNLNMTIAANQENSKSLIHRAFKYWHKFGFVETVKKIDNSLRGKKEQ